ncbi:biogenesis of lysosome-related organelles complex 1 subunit 5 [Hydra vulgaris]|uniref:biogenesis of lysosome-related organelles complex 1 subunit 5 n=1 Tax=Hydra vulgaris TaxID=6087 RepID=UPI0002B4A46A|nr:biogenesis of lysosome-related organelles complex 1 subunit 5 [Hydra vulgaris]
MSNNIEVVSKDAFAILSRLFDHRAILKGECTFFVTEMELKKSRQMKTFSDIIIAAEKSTQRIPECVELLENRIEGIHGKVINAGSNIIDIISDKSSKIAELREHFKQKRENEWADFIIDINKAKADIIQKHESSMQQFKL